MLSTDALFRPNAGLLARPPVLRMEWRQLLFMHWRLPAEVLRRTVPDALPLDTFDGSAWLGIVPFVMDGTRATVPGGATASRLAGSYRFGELNVRTYVTLDGKPGVYFHSLDAASVVAVRAARSLLGLNYLDAEISAEEEDSGWIAYRAQRVDRGAPPARLDVRYRPTGPASIARPGSLEYFLTERYALYTQLRGRPFRVDIQHAPWALYPAECERRAVEMTRALGVELPDEPPLLHYAELQDVTAFPPVAAGPPER